MNNEEKSKASQKFNIIEKNLYNYFNPNELQSFSPFFGAKIYFWKTHKKAFNLQGGNIKDTLALMYCIHNQVIWTLKNNDSSIYLNPGDFTIFSPSAINATRASFPLGETQGILIFYDMMALKENQVVNTFDIPYDILYEKYIDNDNIIFIKKMLDTEAIFKYFHIDDNKVCAEYQKLKLIELLLFLAQIKLKEIVKKEEYKQELIDIIKEVHDELSLNLDKRITIEELAKKYAINPTTLKQLFKSVYEMPIAKHINEHRMSLAISLLENTDLTVNEIAQKTGFKSISKFSQTFKNKTGKLPTEYRKAL